MGADTRHFRCLSFLVTAVLMVSGTAGLASLDGDLWEGGFASGATIIVSVSGQGHHTSIQAAVDAADNGDTVYIWEGTYYETVSVHKSITLIGNGTSETIIEGGGQDHVVYVGSDGVAIRDMTVRNSGWLDNGVRLFDCSDVELVNLMCHDCHTGIMVYGGDSVLIEDCVCNYNVDSGISVYNSESNTLTGNTCNGNYYSGIELSASHNNYLYNNTCGDFNDQGIDLSLSDHNAVQNNTCRNNVYDGIIVEGEGNVVTGNICERNEDGGISLSYCERTVISNNTCTYNNDSGIQLYRSSNSTIRDNNCSYNYYNGIKLYYDCNWNEIAGNMVAYSQYYYSMGLRIFLGDNNTIYHNNLIGNRQQAYDNSDNMWDNGEGEGNHWSDYYGYDNGHDNRTPGDGIGDTSLPHYGLDNYPYLFPCGWLRPGIPHLEGPSVDPDGVFNLTWNATIRATGYIVQEDTTEAFDSPNPVYDGLQTRVQIGQRGPGTYYYRGRGVNDDYASDWSSSLKVVVDPLPPVPANLVVASFSDGGGLNISWDENREDTIMYHLEELRDGAWAPLANLTQPVCWYRYSGLEDGCEYQFRVRARDPLYQVSGWSDTASGIPVDSVPPESPYGLEVTAVSSHGVTLEWRSRPSGDHAGFNVYRSIWPGPSSWGDPLNDAPIQDHAYVDEGLDPLTDHYYTVNAVDEVPNESGGTTPVRARTFVGELYLEEDQEDPDSIDLMSWFEGSRPADLIFSCEGMDRVWVEWEPAQRTVTVTPHPDWHGTETIAVAATDGEFWVRGELRVIVAPANDPPTSAWILCPYNGTCICEGDPLTLEGDGDDPDLADGDQLTFTWVVNGSTTLGTGRTLENVRLPRGEQILHLVVSDSETASVAASVTVVVLRNETIDLDGDGMTDVWEEEYGLDPVFSLDASGDLDEDGVPNYEEFEEGTNPNKREYWRAPVEGDAQGGWTGWKGLVGLALLAVAAIQAALASWLTVRLIKNRPRKVPEEEAPPQEEEEAPAYLGRLDAGQPLPMATGAGPGHMAGGAPSGASEWGPDQQGAYVAGDGGPGGAYPMAVEEENPFIEPEPVMVMEPMDAGGAPGFQDPGGAEYATPVEGDGPGPIDPAPTGGGDAGFDPAPQEGSVRYGGAPQYREGVY